MAHRSCSRQPKPQEYGARQTSHLRQYLTHQEARDQAAELELQYDAHGLRDASTVRRVDPPVPVEAFQPAGHLDAWVREKGEWVGRICGRDGDYTWIPQTDLRAVEDR